MQSTLITAFFETLSTPRQGLARVRSWGLGRTNTWVLAVVVVVASVFLQAFLLSFQAPSEGGPIFLPTSPFLLALVFWGSLVFMVFGVHYIGRMFGGQGHFADSLTAIVWLQVVVTILQFGQLLMMIVSPGFAALAGIALFVYMIYLLVIFVSEVHGFQSLSMVFLGLIGAIAGISVGLSILIFILALITGISPQNV
jgi:hypothetical protein